MIKPRNITPPFYKPIPGVGSLTVGTDRGSVRENILASESPEPSLTPHETQQEQRTDNKKPSKEGSGARIRLYICECDVTCWPSRVTTPWTFHPSRNYWHIIRVCTPLQGNIWITADANNIAQLYVTAGYCTHMWLEIKREVDLAK